MADIKVDFSSAPIGKIRQLHGVNSGPMTKAFTYDSRDFFREAGFPFARLHDVEYPYGSGEFVDIPCIFKNFDADESLEENYNFSLSDEYIKHIIGTGCKPFFRLGVSIEHAPIKRHVFPPKNYAKWARICEHIIRHYNEGWANGYHWDITYWEIWNEADGGSNMWVGTPGEFYELYCVSARHLKSTFPHLKIGGCGFTRAKNTFTENFLKYISSSEERVPLDFYSWHRYFIDPEDFIEDSAQARQLLDKYGYSHVESVFNEWNYMRDWKDQFDSYPKIKSYVGAAYCAAVLCAMQTRTDVELGMYFEADVTKEWCGLFEVTHMAISRQRAILGPLKPFYSFKCFNELYSMGNEIAVKCDGDVYACAASDNERRGLLLTNYGGEARALSISLTGLAKTNVEVRVTDADRSYEKIYEASACDALELQLDVAENTVVYIGTIIDDTGKNDK